MKHSSRSDFLKKGEVREMCLRLFSGGKNGGRIVLHQHKYLLLMLGNAILQIQYETRYWSVISR